MAEFSVASFSTDLGCWLRGFSFTPNVSGPNGSGSPGTASVVLLNTIVVGSPSAAGAGEGPTCYVYANQLTDPDDIGSAQGLIATSTGSATGSAFGSGTYSITYSFANMRASLSVSTVYYVYFSANKLCSINDAQPYTGGTAYDIDLDDREASVQFQVNMATG